MKKTFSFHAPGKQDARVIETIKADVRRYVKRERRKELPAGFEQWDFHCKAGADAASALATPLAGIGAAIDVVAAAGGDQVYLEVIAVPAHRRPTPSPATPPSP